MEIDFVMEIEGTGEAANAEPEALAPEPFAVSCPGDIWTCGDHRIGCGDALNEAFIATLLAGTQPPMAFIDPPYNVPIDGFVSGNGQTRHREFLQASGEMSEGQFISFLPGGLRALKGVLSKGGLVCPKAGPCAQSAGLPVPDGSRRASIHRGDQQCGRVYPKRADDGPARGPLALADWPQG